MSRIMSAKRYLSQKYIGRTADMETIIESEIEYMDGTVGSRYETWKVNECGFFFHTGNHESCPPISVPPNAPRAGYIQTKEEAADHWVQSVQGYEAIKADYETISRRIYKVPLRSPQPITLIVLRQKLDQAATQDGSPVRDRFIPLNCCVLDYDHQRLYSVDRLAYLQLDGDQVVLIEEEGQDAEQ